MSKSIVGLSVKLDQLDKEQKQGGKKGGRKASKKDGSGIESEKF
jgi:hypothetical protein